MLLDVADNKVMLEVEGDYTAVVLQGKSPQDVANALHDALNADVGDEDIFHADVRRLEPGSGAGGAGAGPGSRLMF